MILVTHALRNKEPTWEVKLGKNIWFVMEVIFVHKNAVFCLLHSHLTTTVSSSFKQWHVWRSLGLISWKLRDGDLQTLLARTSLSVDGGAGFISSGSRRYHWALLTAFISNWRILSLYKQLQFLLTFTPEERISHVSKNHWNDWWDPMI